MTPEQEARIKIDAKLIQSGWVTELLQSLVDERNSMRHRRRRSTPLL